MVRTAGSWLRPSDEVEDPRRYVDGNIIYIYIACDLHEENTHIDFLISESSFNIEW